MKIGFIGAGRVGCALGKYLKEKGAGFSLTGYYSKSIASARGAAQFTDSHCYETPEALLADSEAVFVTTPDGAVASVWKGLCRCKIPMRDKLLVHCSGVLTSSICADAESMGVTQVSLHPLYAISDRWESCKVIGKALFTIEGSGPRLEEFHELLSANGLMLQRLKADKKITYHAAATTASNLMIGLGELAISLLEDCGFQRPYAMAALRPLMQGNLDAMMEKGTTEALTGPAERADVETVERHLQALTGEEREIYRLLTKKIVALAEKKHPERDYGPLERLL